MNHLIIFLLGSGICHGTAGNAYAFLAAYKSTSNMHYLHKALVFTRIIIRLGANDCCSRADRPTSLFEGLAGVVQYMLDVKMILLKLVEVHSSTKDNGIDVHSSKNNDGDVIVFGPSCEQLEAIQLFDGLNIF